MTRTAIILAAHGAGDGTAANEQVARVAQATQERLRATHAVGAHDAGREGLADANVIAAFNLGSPRFADALDHTDAVRIIVVPLMTSAGHFASTVLPRDLRQHSRGANVDWRFTDPVGVHAKIESLAFDVMAEAASRLSLESARTVGVVVGHGTPRHASSRDATVALASRLARKGGFRSCIAAFLDEDLRIEDVPERLPGDHLIVLPFLIGGGYHALKDIPARLHMSTLQQDEPGAFPVTARANGRTIVCTAALGTDPRLVDVIVDLVQRAFANDEGGVDVESGAPASSHTGLSPQGAAVRTAASVRVIAPNETPAAPLRLGTRRSVLALWQARHVAERLAGEGRAVQLIEMTTTGDRDLTKSIADLGGDAPFTDDLDQALREHRIDLAVHSLKDMPLRVPEDIAIAAILERGDVGESLVSHCNLKLAELPAGGVVGTSSPRRAAQLLAMRRDLRPIVIRGPVDDRVRQVRAGRFDAAILATAGLRRLGLMHEIAEELPLSSFLPAPGQGAMAVVARANDLTRLRELSGLDHADTRRATSAELEMLRCFERRADVTVAAHAVALRDDSGLLRLTARVLTLRGRIVWEGTQSGDDPTLLGRRAAAMAEQALDRDDVRAL